MVNFTKVFFVQGYSKDYGLFKENLNVPGKIFQSGVVTLFLDDVVNWHLYYYLWICIYSVMSVATNTYSEVAMEIYFLSLLLAMFLLSDW